MSKLEKTADIAVLLACTLLLGGFARDYYLRRQATQPTPRKGQIVKLPDQQPANTSVAAPKTQPATLLLALSTQCVDCKAGVPFYQKLAALRNEEAMKGELRLVAVLPQEKSESESYLRENGIAVDEVISEPLELIQVKGTPTLMLLNRQNRLQEFWEGPLEPEQETEVLKLLQQVCSGCREGKLTSKIIQHGQ